MHSIKVTSNMSILNKHILVPRNTARNKMAVLPRSRVKKSRHSCMNCFFFLKMGVSIACHTVMSIVLHKLRPYVMSIVLHKLRPYRYMTIVLHKLRPYRYMCIVLHKVRPYRYMSIVLILDKLRPYRHFYCIA